MKERLVTSPNWRKGQKEAMLEYIWKERHAVALTHNEIPTTPGILFCCHVKLEQKGPPRSVKNHMLTHVVPLDE